MLRWRRTNRTSRCKRILIVDDNGAIRQIIQDRLENSSWHVSTAVDGQAAIEAITQAKPDLVLLDIKMPRTDGHAVLRHLRQHPDTKDVKVIMVTGSDDTSDITEAATYNIHGYITKPFHPTDLVLQVARVIETDSH